MWSKIKLKAKGSSIKCTASGYTINHRPDIALYNSTEDTSPKVYTMYNKAHGKELWMDRPPAVLLGNVVLLLKKCSSDMNKPATNQKQTTSPKNVL